MKHTLIGIFLLALALRLYHLPSVPIGFHADEVRAGWNAYSILQTGKDDRGNTLALYYNTFGDYRPTGILYITIPSIVIFGLNEFAVRFPSSLFGALTVFPLYLLVKEFLKKDTLKEPVALTASTFLAISPWHIATSRATSEVVISMFFALVGLWLFTKSIKASSRSLAIFAFLSITISFSFYHSVRLLAPAFILAILSFMWSTHQKLNKKIAVAFLVGVSLLTLLLISNSRTTKRFSQISIFNDLDVAYELSRMPFDEGPGRVFVARLFHNKPVTYTKRFIKEYASYFSSDFYITDAAKPARYTTVGMGLLTYVEAFLLIAGFIALAQKRFSLLPAILLILAPIPAALTTEDAPNLHRALYMLPFLLTVEAIGFVWLQKPILKKLFILFITLNTIYYLHMYYVHAKFVIASDRSVGSKELANYALQVQNRYDKIVFTNIPDDPYPWIAFYGLKNPHSWNLDAIKRSDGVWTTQNFVFSTQRCPSRDAFIDTKGEKILVVDAEGCATESNLKNNPNVEIVKEIKRPNDSVVYTLWATKEK